MRGLGGADQKLYPSYSQGGLGSQEPGVTGQAVSRVMASSGGRTGPSHGTLQGAAGTSFLTHGLESSNEMGMLLG